MNYLSKWQSLCRKEVKEIILSEGELNALEDHLCADDKEFQEYGKYMASVPNPNQVGTKDAWLIFLKK